MAKEYDIIIVGAGVAGMTAALNALRGGKNVLIIERNTFGGQIATSPKVENYPAIASISGLELSEKIFSQVLEHGADFELEEVISITKENNIFTVITNYNTYNAKAVILATGVKHKNLNIPNETELVGKGISYCAICDGAFYEGEEVCVVGDGNTAVQYAIMLANICNKVTICTLFDKFFCEKIYIDRINTKENIKIIHNVSLKKIIGQDKLESCVFETSEGKELTLNPQGLFIAIGQIPDNNKYVPLVELDKNGYIITNDKCETKTKGLYAIGDCRVKQIRQLSTAISDGSIASFYALDYINNL